ncbi:hypothetical protein CTEN210_01324 [Chaetoceros tenuissimus]|uniref:CDP-diacylglycerol--inositol 3-phosphatidyltransferase n=1 Tax=Chaetoceros tenuissimus TaxID=426638 RepID=A0AAD3CHR9_9STRA|nr:hypothetical protein CTEN210_01324 [Chaetoceros tenuissimus]
MCYARIALSFASIYTASQIYTVQTGSEPCPGSVIFFLLTITSWVASFILDHFDGKLARKYNQCSDLGILLDIIADNLLRTSSYLGCVVTYYGKNLILDDAKENNVVSQITNGWILVCTCLLLSSMEWITLLATQLVTLHRKKKHWKNVSEAEDLFEKSNDNDNIHIEEKKLLLEEECMEMHDSSKTPWWIESIFRNNFHNPLGVITIYGSMGCGLANFFFINGDILRSVIPSWTIPCIHIAILFAYIGRVLALLCEVYFCYDLFQLIIQLDYNKKE